MLLTGAALRDFIKFSSTGNGYIYLNQKTTAGIHYSNLIDSVLNALIIEWFDSVGIIILPKRFTHKLEFSDWYFIITNEQGVHLNNHLEDRVKTDSRKEVQIEAIKKANEIYNQLNK